MCQGTVTEPDTAELFKAIPTNRVTLVPDNDGIPVSVYNSTFEAALNEFASDITKVIPVRKRQPWYTPQLRCVRQHLRRLESKWKNTQSKIDLLLFKDQRLAYNNLLDSTKGQYTMHPK